MKKCAPIRKQILSILKDGAKLDVHEFSSITGASAGSVRNFFRRLLKESPRVVYICAWRRCPRDVPGPWIPVFAYGNGFDAVRPAATTPSELAARKWSKVKGNQEKLKAINAERRRKYAENPAVRERVRERNNLWAKKKRAEIRENDIDTYDAVCAKRRLAQRIKSGHIPHDPIVLALLRPRNEVRDDYEQRDQESERFSF